MYYIEIRGIPLSTRSQRENTNDMVKKVAEKIGVQIVEEDISVSHRLPVSQSYRRSTSAETAPIIVKFVGRDVKERVYRARKKLKEVSTKDLCYSVDKNIFISESITQRNKRAFQKGLSGEEG